MSIKRMSAVWDVSIHKGSNLLLLLAIADNANDQGYAWPGIDYLAQKTRLSRSTVIRNTKVLEESGELYVDHNTRPGNRYIVLPGLGDNDIGACLSKHFGCGENDISVILQQIKKQRGEPDKCQDDTTVVSLSETTVVSSVTPDPSVNHQGTSNSASPTTTDTIKEAPQDESKLVQVTQSTETLLSGIVASRLFNAAPGTSQVAAVSGRVAKCKEALHLIESNLKEFEEACDWWANTKQLTLPRDPEKVAGMVLDFRKSKVTQENTTLYRMADGSQMTWAQMQEAEAKGVMQWEAA